MTTSLMVVSDALPTARIRSTGQSWAANRREPVIDWLNMVRGAWSDRVEVSLRIDLVSVLISAPGRPAASAVMPSAVRSAWAGSSSRRSSSSSLFLVDLERSGSTPHGAGIPIRSGSVERTLPSRRIALTPSRSAWWILVYIATRPSRSPSMTWASQSGRSQASRVPWRREHSSSSSRTRPGLGSALWRTWCSMSNCSSGFHTS
jgi:hypothetical protein